MRNEVTTITICKKCKHCRGRSECYKTEEKTMDWTTGKLTTWYRLCGMVNTDGQCDMYEAETGLLEDAWAWVKKFLSSTRLTEMEKKHEQ